MRGGNGGTAHGLVVAGIAHFGATSDEASAPFGIDYGVVRKTELPIGIDSFDGVQRTGKSELALVKPSREPVKGMLEDSIRSDTEVPRDMCDGLN